MDALIPALDPTTGLLPHGRFRVAEGDVERRFVSDASFASSTTRSEVWNHYRIATALLRSVVRVHAAWLGGSFTTAKTDPDDLDVLYLVSMEDLLARSPNEKRIANAFTSGRGHLPVPLRVDTFLLPWPAIAELQPGPDPNSTIYCQQRGYWDDFWSRCRSGPKGVAPVRDDAPPKRGYLEVIFDDFS